MTSEVSPTVSDAFLCDLNLDDATKARAFALAVARNAANIVKTADDAKGIERHIMRIHRELGIINNGTRLAILVGCITEIILRDHHLNENHDTKVMTLGTCMTLFDLVLAHLPELCKDIPDASKPHAH